MEIAENLEAALEQFSSIVEELVGEYSPFLPHFASK